MLKVFTVKCTTSCSVNKLSFIEGVVYKAFYNGTGYSVSSNGQRIGFCNMDVCMKRHGHPNGFQKHFEIISESFVGNKKELTAFLHEEKDPLLQ